MRAGSSRALREGPLQGFAPALAIAAALGLLVASCSFDTDYPAVHDMPAPRADTPLTPDQVKEVTSDLLSERNHLSTQTPGSASGDQATVKKAPLPPLTPAAAQGTVSAGTQNAGTEAKP